MPAWTGRRPSACSTGSRARCGPAARWRDRRPMRVALLGVGLIGGSVGMAARRRLGAHVVGWNRSPEALQIARERGAIDEAVASIADIGTADIAIAGVAVDALEGAVRELCGALPGAVVTDVGSTKGALVDAIECESFIGGHPPPRGARNRVAPAPAGPLDRAAGDPPPPARAPGGVY